VITAIHVTIDQDASRRASAEKHQITTNWGADAGEARHWRWLAFRTIGMLRGTRSPLPIAQHPEGIGGLQDLGMRRCR